MDNITMQPDASPAEQQVNLLEVNINNELVALNVLCAFVNIANRRGAFSIQESAKIWDCVKFFLPRNQEPQMPSPPPISVPTEAPGTEGEMQLNA